MMLITHENPVRKLLKAGKRVTGAWAQAASPITAEILGEAGFDVVMIDLEHGPGDIMTLITQVQALKGVPAVPFVRAAWNDFVHLKRVLDAGAYGVLVPYVNSAAEAEAAVRAVQYPPAGIRGVAGSPRAAHYGSGSGDYLRTVDGEIILMTAVETPEAIAALDEVLEVPRLDGIFIGPMDLATSMGRFCDPGHPEVQAAIAGIERKVLASGKFLATVSGSWEDARKKFERGYRLLLMFSDTVSLRREAGALVEEFSAAYPQR